MSISAWWQAEQVAALEKALDTAAAGGPAVLAIEGDPGTGKSTLLTDLEGRARAAGFHFLGAEARRASEDDPFHLLVGLGVDANHVTPSTDPFQAAQALRELVDATTDDGRPCLLVADDLQWGDPESVEALTWLLRRADGDPLLLALATRPPGARTDAWRRLTRAGEPRVDVSVLQLEGLTRELTGRLVLGEVPDADTKLVDRLWRHTEGNPLYLRTLLREYDVPTLQAMEELPAPSEVTRTIRARLEGLDPDAVSLVRAAAVLGDGWSPLLRATELSQVRRPGQALRVLQDEGLLRLLGAGAQSQVRVAHAVLRAAVHQDIPEESRAALHRRAAASAASPTERLWHLCAATDGYDEGLAADLCDAAQARHTDGAHRDCARLLGWAAAVTESPAMREARRLDSAFEVGLARDSDELARRLRAHQDTAEVARYSLATALGMVLGRQWVSARDVLDDVSDEACEGAGVKTRYRLLTLRAWAGAVTGRPGVEVLADLDAAARTGCTDEAMAPYTVLARQQAEAQAALPSRAIELVRSVSAVEAHRHLSQPELYRLGWAGGVLAVAGSSDDALRCLRRFTESLRSGPRDPTDGGYRALLGYAQWMRGDWAEAQVTIRLAQESRFGPAHPMVAAVAPLIRIAAGDLEGAQETAAQSRAALVLAPWNPAVQVCLVVEVILAAVDDNRDVRRHALDRFARELDFRAGGRALPLTALHRGLAMVWAGRLDEAEGVAHQQVLLDPPWWAGARAWLEGLVALERGDPEQARLRLQDAVPALTALPLHRAQAAGDLLRTAQLVGDEGAAARASEIAATVYSRLGWHDRAARLTPTTTIAPDDPLALLSDRERDVVALLAKGMSYEQMARELYVSRSTVAFHLGNVYAKTDTGSRHELVELLRERATV